MLHLFLQVSQATVNLPGKQSFASFKSDGAYFSGGSLRPA